MEKRDQDKDFAIVARYLSRLKRWRIKVITTYLRRYDC